MLRDPPLEAENSKLNLAALLLRAEALLYTYAQTGEVQTHANDPPR